MIVIVGPTASGKTALACDLAERLGGEVISADSQQCYRGLDVGTAKPGAGERARVRHHLLDVADPEEQLDAAAFVRLADEAIADIQGRGKVPIVAGGTGLWIRALLRGLLPGPDRNEAFRAAFRADLAARGLAAAHARLAAVDPESAARIQPNDRVRIERALEVHHLTGRSMSALQREHGFAEKRYEARVIHLDPPRELLRARIEVRTRAIFAPGSAFFDEVRRLVPGGKALKIIGYGEAFAALDQGPEALAASCERTIARTYRYAKRQQTWFRREYGPGLWPQPVGL